ncbi:MAG: biotin transporter BioY [Marinosulfonomonas sp.]|nr:biotin transporter BioY [Marinosulfonomonas sp.]
MALTATNRVLAQAFGADQGLALRAKQAALVVAGIAALAVSAKIMVPMLPVPMSMGTFAVLTIGAAYGARLGLATIFGYMLIGALGFDVFAKSTADLNGLSYMMGSTGGYLVGFVLATFTLGYAAKRGWDRNVATMGIAMLAGTALIYIPGAAWLSHLYGFDASTAFAKGVAPFLIGDALKLALAAMIFPAVWKMVGKARG